MKTLTLAMISVVLLAVGTVVHAYAEQWSEVTYEVQGQKIGSVDFSKKELLRYGGDKLAILGVAGLIIAASGSVWGEVQRARRA